MSENVPSDWHSWWRTCSICGRRYHASEGGCCCLDGLDDCACGERDWRVTGDGRVICSSCRTEPGTQPEPDDYLPDEVPDDPIS